jgi:hypothetical protein
LDKPQYALRPLQLRTKAATLKINNNGFPDKVVMDKSGANYAGLANINLSLKIRETERYVR